MYNAINYSPYPYSFNPAMAGTTAPYQPQRQEIIKVNGENGARAYNLNSPNSSVLMLDETQPLVWLKTTDGAGYPTLTAYTIEPYKPEQEVNSDLEKRIKRLEDIINESYTCNVAEFKSRKPSGKNISDPEHDERKSGRDV